MDALVTDVHTRSAVAGLRALGRAGVRTLALGPSRGAAGLWSRHSAARLTGPDVLEEPLSFSARIARLGTEFGPFVVYPVQEEAVDALLARASSLPNGVVLPYRDEKAVHALRDKERLSALAGEAGLKVPLIMEVGTAGELRGRRVRTPCVVKAVLPEQGLSLTHVVNSQRQLDSLLEGLTAEESLLVQEHVVGPLIAVALVVDHTGRVVARFQQRARRTWPPEAGASRLAESVPADPRLVSMAARLLANAGYAGLAELQFVDGGRGPMLVDVNPRFYGSLPLALASGVNLAAAWHAVVTGERFISPDPYRVGVTYRWMEADLLAALRGSPHLLLRKGPRPTVGAMWAPDDPLPGPILAATALGSRLRKRLARIIRR